jgi:hypothetical protein
MTAVAIQGDRAVVEFGPAFPLDDYAVFLRAKRLPESDITYDPDADRYTLTTPARFAVALGAAGVPLDRPVLPLAEHLFDYQRAIVERGLEAKRYAIWADTGLGKTAMFLDWARQVVARTGGKVLILSPLQIIEHVCPLQLEVIRRLVRLYTNPGELVLDPFMGIGSTAVVAVQEGRNAVGFELKESYHAIAERYVRRALHGPDTGQLSLLGAIEAAS